MEYKRPNSFEVDLHKYKFGQEVWFEIDENELLAGIIESKHYITEVTLIDNRNKMQYLNDVPTHKRQLLDLFKTIKLSTETFKQIGEFIIVDISSVGFFVEEIIGNIMGNTWKWDQPVVLGKVISCNPTYKIFGQYKKNEPTLEQLKFKSEGEMYPQIFEKDITLRD